MMWGALLFLSLVLFELFGLLKLGGNAKTILVSSQQAMRVLKSAELADEEKESFMRRGSVEILKATLILAGKLMLAGAVLFALFELIVVIFPGLREPLLESFLSPSVIVILTVVLIGYAWARKAALRAMNR